MIFTYYCGTELSQNGIIQSICHFGIFQSTCEISMANKLWDGKYQAFTAAMKTLRTDKDISQTELANRLGKPQSFVSKYESGERTLDFVETLAICEALEADVQEIIHSYKKSIGLDNQ